MVFESHPPMTDDSASADPVHPFEVAAYVSSFAAELADMSRRAGLLHVAAQLERAQRAASLFIEGRTDEPV